jgi:hypothetical protein
MSDEDAGKEEHLQIVQDLVIKLGLFHLDQEDLIEDVEGAYSEEDVIPGVEDVIMKDVQELPHDHVCSTFGIPSSMRKTLRAWKLRIHKKACENREHNTAESSNNSHA